MELIYQEDIKIQNIYILNNRASKYMEHTDGRATDKRTFSHRFQYASLNNW